MEIVIASRNVHKIREFRDIFHNVDFLDIVSLIDFPDYRAPEETGQTFEENAQLKAEHAAKFLNRWVIADDSGLVVPALNGFPGVYSRRYAGEDASDHDNRKKLIAEMIEKNGLERAAYYQCTLCLAGPEGIKKTVTAYCEGYIGEKEKGSNGFGYDPLFIKHDYDKTFAELEESTKNRISHRSKAIEKMRSALESLSIKIAMENKEGLR